MALLALDWNVLKDLEKIPHRVDQVHQCALYYASRGYSVVPLNSGSKRLGVTQIDGKKIKVLYNHGTTDTDQIDYWFRSMTGIFRGRNLGLVSGRKDGLFVVDMDIPEPDKVTDQDNPDGISQFTDLCNAHGIIDDTMQQFSSSGGLHLLFNWLPGARTTNKHIGANIDTRGGTEVSAKGVIAVWPSIIGDKTYIWDRIEAPIDPSEWLLKLLPTHKGIEDLPAVPEYIKASQPVVPRGSEHVTTQNMKNPGGRPRGSENVSDKDKYETPSLKDTEKMLAVIDLNELDTEFLPVVSYYEWLGIGQGIHSVYPDDEGLRIWGEWSRTGKRHKPGECTMRWQGFEADTEGGRTIGTVIHWAKKFGYKMPRKKHKKSSKLSKHIPVEIFDTVTEVVNQDFCMITEGDLRVLDKHSDELRIYKTNAFFILIANQQHSFITEKGREIKTPYSKIWTENPNREDYKGFGVYPDNDQPKDHYNLWKGLPLKPKQGNVQPYLDHVKHIICDNEEAHYQWVLDWLADIVQDPGNPCGTSIVMRGLEGSGKGFFMSALEPIFQHYYTGLIDPEHLVGRFNSHLANILLLFADEITWGGYKKTSGKLKGLVTEKNITMEMKGHPLYKVRNLLRLVVSSNEQWVIPAGADSRRWFVVEVSPQRCGDIGYFVEVNKWLADDGPAHLLDFLLKREYDKENLRKAPITASLLEQRSLSIGNDAILCWLEYCVDRNSFEIDEPVESMSSGIGWPLEAQKNDLVNAFHLWAEQRSKEFRYLGPTGVKQALSKLGFEARKRRVPRSDNQFFYTYRIPSRRELIDILATKGMMIMEDDESTKLIEDKETYA